MMRGICFVVRTTPAAHSQAKSDCTALGGYLATADSATEQRHLEWTISKRMANSDTHLGVTWYVNYNNWSISHNLQPLTGYTNWHSNSTYNVSTHKDCVAISVQLGYKWMDINCSTQLPYICAVPTCPFGYRTFNGSCYLLDPNIRNWMGAMESCLNNGANIVWVTVKEENDYLKNIYNTEWGTSYPVPIGLQDYQGIYAFRWTHNDWISLDWNNKWNDLGCWNDSILRALTVREGEQALINDDFRTRSDAITKCYYVMRWRNWKIFGVQNGGQCEGDPPGSDTGYSEYGAASGCVGGKGASWQNNVYEITNYNLFVDFAFDKYYWNQGQRTFYWWHYDSFQWLDCPFTQTARTVCKVEFCPPGFVAYVNKCFKVLDAYQNRNATRAACQSYTGADLYNPEYQDELTLMDTLINTDMGLRGQLFWVGLYGTSTSISYQVMLKTVADNYEVYRMGAEPFDRDYQNGAAVVSHVEMRWKFNTSGTVIGWEYYSGTAGRPIKFSVLRAVGTLLAGSCTFTVVGQNAFTSVAGFARADVATSSQITVQKGDYIAVTFTAGSNVKFDNSAAGINICGGPMDTPSSGTVTFTNNFGQVYAFRALWRTSTYSGLPYDYSNSNVFTNQPCFIMDSARGFLLRDQSCTNSYRGVCEIKKRKRTQPV